MDRPSAPGCAGKPRDNPRDDGAPRRAPEINDCPPRQRPARNGFRQPPQPSARTSPGSRTSKESRDEMGLLEERRLDLDDMTEAGGPALRPSNTATLIKSFFRHIVSSRHIGAGRPAEVVLQRLAQRYRHCVHRCRRRPLPAADMPAGVSIPEVGFVQASFLPWSSVFAGGDACGAPLPSATPRNHHVVVVCCGGCRFSEKLARIPAFTPTSKNLHPVIIVSDDKDGRLRRQRKRQLVLCVLVFP